MTWYVGLTDDPDRRRSEHGAPSDWQQTTRAFDDRCEGLEFFSHRPQNLS